MPELSIRPARESDLEAFYQLQLEPEYNRMAAFGSANPEDKIAFMDHKHKILRDPSCLFYAIELNFEPIGNIGSFSSTVNETGIWHRKRTLGQRLCHPSCSGFCVD
jgi:RimJ/RimL family protein N-acetyltransferase